MIFLCESLNECIQAWIKKFNSNDIAVADRLLIVCILLPILTKFIFCVKCLKN
jgi:hypothetical protein